MVARRQDYGRSSAAGGVRLRLILWGELPPSGFDACLNQLHHGLAIVLPGQLQPVLCRVVPGDFVDERRIRLVPNAYPELAARRAPDSVSQFFVARFSRLGGVAEGGQNGRSGTPQFVQLVGADALTPSRLLAVWRTSVQ
jgi:hypothetical protein